jgi:hypothetical protein
VAVVAVWSGGYGWARKAPAVARAGSYDETMATYRDVTMLTQDSAGLRERLVKLSEKLERQYGDRSADPIVSRLLTHVQAIGPAADRLNLELDSARALIKELEGSGGLPVPGVGWVADRPSSPRIRSSSPAAGTGSQ